MPLDRRKLRSQLWSQRLPPEAQLLAPPGKRQPVGFIGFDFDCTLTVRHFFKCFCHGYAQGNRFGHAHCEAFYEWCSRHGVEAEKHSLASQRDSDAMNAAVDAFCRNTGGEDVFHRLFREVFLGGEERIQAVARWLERASDEGIEFAIVTAGVATSVLRALCAVPEWLKYFPSDRIWDSSQSRHSVRSVMAAKALTLRDICPGPCKIFLIDDSFVNDKPPDWLLAGANVEVIGLEYEGPGVDEAFLVDIEKRVLGSVDDKS